MQPTAVTAVAVAIAPAEASKDHRMRGSNARGMDIQPTAPFVSRRGLSNTNQRLSQEAWTSSQRPSRCLRAFCRAANGSERTSDLGQGL